MQRRPIFIYWLALQRLFFSKPREGLRLLSEFSSPEDIFRFSQRVTEKDLYRCEADLKWCEDNNISIATYSDPNYPKLLKEIYDPPLLLMMKGDPSYLSGPCVAMVGARRATSHGREVAFEIAKELASRGIVVVSGMAFGIDASSHRGALQAGSTAAVWGSGVDECYPAALFELSLKISSSGCIVSEFPLRMETFPANFPQRNRIISGLSHAVVVVEAAKKSGSLITARYALEQGREVFAVPGPARGVTSEGTHMLLKNGATLVESGDEIIYHLRLQLVDFKNPRHFSRDVNNTSPLLNFFPQRGFCSVDLIVEKSGLTCAEVLQELTKLVMSGMVEEMPGRLFRIIKRG